MIGRLFQNENALLYDQSQKPKGTIWILVVTFVGKNTLKSLHKMQIKRKSEQPANRQSFKNNYLESRDPQIQAKIMENVLKILQERI